MELRVLQYFLADRGRFTASTARAGNYRFDNENGKRI